MKKNPRPHRHPHVRGGTALVRAGPPLVRAGTALVRAGTWDCRHGPSNKPRGPAINCQTPPPGEEIFLVAAAAGSKTGAA